MTCAIIMPDCSPPSRGEERRQVAQRRVDEPLGAPLADRRQLRRRRWPAGRRRCATGAPWKLPPDTMSPRVGEDHRVVGGGVGLDRRRCRATKRERLAGRAVHLRGAAQRSRRPARGRSRRATRVDGAAARAAPRGWRPTPPGPANGRAAWIRGSKGPRRAAQRRRSTAPRRCRRRARGARRRRARGASTAVEACVPLISASPSFGAERDRREARRAARAAAPGTCAVAVPRLALADEHEREVRERREVAARADRAAARHDRVHAAVQQREQRLERLDAGCRRSRGRARWRAAPSSRARCGPGAGRRRRPRGCGAGSPAGASSVVARDLHLGERRRSRC